MKIAMLEAPKQIRMVDQALPPLGRSEVLVRVAACGVCTSELDVWDGSAGTDGFPRFPGHEVSGIVEAVGEEVATVRPGDAVGVLASRGFAEYVAVGADRCFGAGELPLEIAAWAEPLACAVNAVELADVSLGDDVLIIGSGFMGSLVQLLAGLRGPRNVIVADTRTEALERARAMGATHVVDPAEEDLTSRVKELTDGRGADVSFEVTGRQAPLLALGDATRMSGTVAIVGYHQGGMREIPLAQWNWMAFKVVNAHFRESATILRGMRTGMRLLTSGRLKLDALATHRFPLDEVQRAFETAHEKPEGFVKATVSTGVRR